MQDERGDFGADDDNYDDDDDDDAGLNDETLRLRDNEVTSSLHWILCFEELNAGLEIVFMYFWSIKVLVSNFMFEHFWKFLLSVFVCNLWTLHNDRFTKLDISSMFPCFFEIHFEGSLYFEIIF